MMAAQQIGQDSAFGDRIGARMARVSAYTDICAFRDAFRSQRRTGEIGQALALARTLLIRHNVGDATERAILLGMMLGSATREEIDFAFAIYWPK